MAALMALTQLAALDHVKVSQEARRSFAGNKYVIRTEEGEELLTAKEEGFVFGGHNRNFVMPVYDVHGLEMMRFVRTIGCMKNTMEVEVQGSLACVVREKMTWWGRLLYIEDPAGQLRYRVRGTPFGDTVDFQLQTADKSSIGVVRKEYAGFKKEFFTWLDNYTLRFPADMDLRYKAGVIGASIMLDFALYERN